MDLKEKRQAELNDIKNKRISHVLDNALNLFAAKGIDVIAMTDIASASEIGVASLYRYFNTKEELAIQCAKHHWEKLSSQIMAELQNNHFEDLDGFNQLKLMFSLFTDLFESNRPFFQFIYYFDAFVNKNNITSDRLDSYDMTIGYTKNLICLSIEKGFSDKSLNIKWADKGIELLYYTIMHSLFAMAQKLSLSENMLATNKEINTRNQIELLQSMLLDTIKGE